MGMDKTRDGQHTDGLAKLQWLPLSELAVSLKHFEAQFLQAICKIPPNKRCKRMFVEFPAASVQKSTYKHMFSCRLSFRFRQKGKIAVGQHQWDPTLG